MSGTTSVYRAAGPTIGLSVGATSHAAVPLVYTTNDQANFCAVVNTGAVAVAVKLSAAGLAAVLPGDGTQGDFILPAAMTQPMVLPLPWAPTGNAQITAIGAAVGPSLIYVTPLVVQT